MVGHCSGAGGGGRERKVNNGEWLSGGAVAMLLKLTLLMIGAVVGANSFGGRRESDEVGVGIEDISITVSSLSTDLSSSSVDDVRIPLKTNNENKNRRAKA